MLDSILESLRDMLPLLIFIIFPLLGRMGSWLTKRSKALEQEAKSSRLQSDSRAVERSVEEGVESPDGGGLQAFLKPQSAEPELVLEEAPAQPVPVLHQREEESLKEHLSHRGHLSMEDLKPIPVLQKPARPKARTQRLVSASKQSAEAWQDPSIAGPVKRSELDASHLRQAMIWHEILSQPVSLRELDGPRPSL